MTIKLHLSGGDADKELAAVADSILRAKRVVFVSGAGISCSAGIPDFRSMEGLYAAETNDSKIRGKDLFDVSLFRRPDTTAMFYKFMADLRVSTMKAQPTTTHRFLRTLKEHGSLLRSYTQNIDGLEARVGLDIAKDVIQLHGDIHTLKCVICSASFPYTQDSADTLHDGQAPECPSCAHKCAMRLAAGRRPVAIGRLRPDIVLYGEDHPAGDTIATACAADLRKKPDCLIIAGTSLKVAGFKRLIKDFAKSVHKQKGKVILLNMTDVGTTEWHSVIDVYVQGKCDQFIDFVKCSRPDAFLKQATLDALPRTKAIMSIGALCNGPEKQHKTVKSESCHGSKPASAPKSSKRKAGSGTQAQSQVKDRSTSIKVRIKTKTIKPANASIINTQIQVVASKACLVQMLVQSIKKDASALPYPLASSALVPHHLEPQPKSEAFTCGGTGEGLGTGAVLDPGKENIAPLSTASIPAAASLKRSASDAFDECDADRLAGLGRHVRTTRSGRRID